MSLVNDLSTAFGTLATLLRHPGSWFLVWSMVLLWLGLLLCYLASTRRTPRHWVVRKGECPGCGSALFGTTQSYESLHRLETLSPDNLYLCTSCDRAKVTALLSKYHLELADD